MGGKRTKPVRMNEEKRVLCLKCTISKHVVAAPKTTYTHSFYSFFAYAQFGISQKKEKNNDPFDSIVCLSSSAVDGLR